MFHFYMTNWCNRIKNSIFPIFKVNQTILHFVHSHLWCFDLNKYLQPHMASMDWSNSVSGPARVNHVFCCSSTRPAVQSLTQILGVAYTLDSVKSFWIHSKITATSTSMIPHSLDQFIIDDSTFISRSQVSLFLILTFRLFLYFACSASEIQLR